MADWEHKLRRWDGGEDKQLVDPMSLHFGTVIDSDYFVEAAIFEDLYVPEDLVTLSLHIRDSWCWNIHCLVERFYDSAPADRGRIRRMPQNVVEDCEAGVSGGWGLNDAAGQYKLRVGLLASWRTLFDAWGEGRVRQSLQDKACLVVQDFADECVRVKKFDVYRDGVANLFRAGAGSLDQVGEYVKELRRNVPKGGRSV